MKDKNSQSTYISNIQNIKYKGTSNEERDLSSNHSILHTLSFKECLENEFSDFHNMQEFISKSEKLSLTESGRDIRFISLGNEYETG